MNGEVKQTAHKRRSGLTQSQLKEALNYDLETGIFTRAKDSTGRWKSGQRAGGIHEGYERIGLSGSIYLAHRLAWLYVYGEWPKDMIDHVNGDGTFNAISNLREADNTLNKQNQRIPNKNSKSKLLGAYARKEKFRSQIMVNRKAIGLGTYETAEEAHQAYLSAKRELHRSCTI